MSAPPATGRAASRTARSQRLRAVFRGPRHAANARSRGGGALRSGGIHPTGALLAVTGWGAAEHGAGAQDAESDVHLVKPVDWRAIGAVCDNLRNSVGQSLHAGAGIRWLLMATWTAFELAHPVRLGGESG